MSGQVFFEFADEQYPIIFRAEPTTAPISVESKQTVLVVMDIDDTIMNTKGGLPASQSWHASPELWIKTLQTIQEKAHAVGAELRIAIVSSKLMCDDLVIEVAKNFLPLMPNACSFIDGILRQINAHVVNDEEITKGYFDLTMRTPKTRDVVFQPRPDITYNPIYIVQRSDFSKKSAYEHILKHYDINLKKDRVFVLDDNIQHGKTAIQMDLTFISFIPMRVLSSTERKQYTEESLQALQSDAIEYLNCIGLEKRTCPPPPSITIANF